MAAACPGPRFAIAQVPVLFGNLCTPRGQASAARAGGDLRFAILIPLTEQGRCAPHASPASRGQGR
jgi:hypothetical protein